MQTSLSELIKETQQGQRANSILRSCVHCGFCNATCPTYQLTGNELDGPRGRIYLIKQMLEGHHPTEKTRLHLDRCLTCLNCQTTCPSGVQYSELLDIGREFIADINPGTMSYRITRYFLNWMLPHTGRFRFMMTLAGLLNPFLPAHLKAPAVQNTEDWIKTQHERKMLIFEGCVQPALSPEINQSTAYVLDKIGITLIKPDSGCCGAVSQHLSKSEQALQFARHNIDVWWPYIETGIEAIVITASGCGTQLKDYARLLEDDHAYADKAEQVSLLCKDLSEIIQEDDLQKLNLKTDGSHQVFHSPCSLQHGQKLSGQVESLLDAAGFQRSDYPEAHLCCGSAGTYSILQPTLSEQLKNRKIQNLETVKPDIITTANIGCLHHLQTATTIPVKHWIVMLAERIE